MIRAASSLRSFRRVVAVQPRSHGIIGCTEDDRQRARPENDTFVLPTMLSAAPHGPSFLLGQRRSMSTMPSGESGDTVSFDDTMSKLFADQDSTAAATAVSDVATTTGEVWDPTWYNMADQAVNLINHFHDVTGLNYAFTIMSLTCIARVFLFPVMVKGQRTQSRMAHMQPELSAIKARIDKMGQNVDRETQMKYGLQMKALFKKYDCNPISGALMPLIQAPIFMSMFFGLTKMPKYFPQELSTGGILWFPDLCIPDPYYILPAVSSLTFLIMIESGKEQMMATNAAQGEMMLNIFRGMSVIMFPVSITFSSAVLCYWVTNNTLTLCQSILFRNPTVRKQLGIWELPKPIPGAEPKSLTESVQDVAGKLSGSKLSEEQMMLNHNEAIENKKKASKRSKASRVRRDGRFTNVKR